MCVVIDYTREYGLICLKLMNRLADIILTHFNLYTSQPNFIKDIIFIILSYCTPFYELSILDLQEKFQVCMLKRLKNNHIALGYSNGNINVLNLTTGVKYSNMNFGALGSIYQIDDTVLMYTLKNISAFYIWDYTDCKVNAINCQFRRYNNIIVLKPWTIAFVTGIFIIKIFDLKTRVVHSLHFKHALSRMQVINDNVLIYLHTNFMNLELERSDNMYFIDLISVDSILELSTKNKKQIYNKQYSVDFYKPDYIIPCDFNNVLIIETDSKELTKITQCNLNDLTHNIILEGFNKKITAYIYLDNHYFAMLVEGDIMIYNILNHALVQHIKCDDGLFTCIEQIDNGFVTLDTNSIIRLYK